MEKIATRIGMQLGDPLPDSDHAVSVALPLWRNVIGYEEKNPEVLNALRAGYPRFVFHPAVEQLFAEARKRFADSNQRCLVFPTYSAAVGCVEYIKSMTKVTATVHEMTDIALFAVVFPQSGFDAAKQFWQHSGQIISSRHAQAVCQGSEGGVEGSNSKAVLRNRLSEIYQVDVADIYLFSCGAGAIYFIHQILKGLFSSDKTVQFGFPYLDTLRVQQRFGTGVHFLPNIDSTALEQLEVLLGNERIAGVFCEVPNNPLLKTVDLARLVEILHRAEVPLICDDTVASPYNLNIIPQVDVLVTSLTKFFSGAGDVMGGVLILNSSSPFYQSISSRIHSTYVDTLHPLDAVTLEHNSQDFVTRMDLINRNGLEVAQFLKEHPKVKEVYYPKFITTDEYKQVLKEGGGFGGLLSFTLVNPEQNTESFYDKLPLCKGPSFGTNFTLVMPYTMLVHYQELDWAEQCGVSRYLIRVSVGLEPSSEIIAAFESALGGYFINKK